VLVNNVGAAHVRVNGFLALSDADFDTSLQMNFFSALRASRAALADMLGRAEGVIVNVASINSFLEPDGGVIDYGAAKAALVNLAKSLSQEFAPRGIRITSVSPGPVATDLWLGEEGVAQTVGSASGTGAKAVRETGRGGDRERALHDSARSRDPGCAAGVATCGQRDGRQLGDRRWDVQDDVSPRDRGPRSSRRGWSDRDRQQRTRERPGGPASTVLEVLRAQPVDRCLQAGRVVDAWAPAEHLPRAAAAEVLVLGEHVDGLAREQRRRVHPDRAAEQAVAVLERESRGRAPASRGTLHRTFAQPRPSAIASVNSRHVTASPSLTLNA